IAIMPTGSLCILQFCGYRRSYHFFISPFCYLNTGVSNYVKIGMPNKNDDAWNGQRIVSQGWGRQSTCSDTIDGSKTYYQYQRWLPTPEEFFIAEGISGQLSTYILSKTSLSSAGAKPAVAHLHFV